MNKILIASVVALLSVTSAAVAASTEDCTAMWKKLDAGGTGMAKGDATKPYLAAMDSMKMPAAGAKDGTITAKEFTDACTKDAFKDIK